MTQTNYGGSVEYVVAFLLVLQIVLARGYLLKRPANWPRTRYLATITGLISLWTLGAVATAFAWAGIVYSAISIPVGLRAGTVAVGYFGILVSSLAVLCIAGAHFLVKKIAGPYSQSRRNWFRAAWAVGIAAPAAAVGYGVFVERNEYGVDQLDLPVPGLHPDLDGFRIVQVSDLHVSPFLSARQAGHVIDMANDLRPDLAVFTGDLISEPGDPLDDAIRELVRLRGSFGAFGCMGNHEQYVGCRKYLAQQTRPFGMIFLRGGNAQIKRGQGILNIAGVDYERTSKKANYLAGAERLTVPGATNLLLSHNPDVFPTAIRRGFQTVLSGHTHGGQINLEILHQNITPARFRTPYISGLYRLDSAGEGTGTGYVTNGIGTIGMPVRLGAPPQIALLRLRRA